MQRSDFFSGLFTYFGENAPAIEAITGIIGAFTGILGFVTAFIAIVQTRKANKFSQDANTLAAGANRIAEESMDIASKANGLATEANKISGDANTISKRALSVTADQTAYNWWFTFNKQTSTINMTNNSPNKAHDVKVIVRYNDASIGQSNIKEINDFESIGIKSPTISKRLMVHQEHINHLSAGIGSFGIPTRARISVEIYLVWTSDLGVKRSKKFKKTFR